jgi:hypothetical protein
MSAADSDRAPRAAAARRVRHFCARILVAVEILIRAGAINRFIVPLPSEVAASFGRVIAEEDIWRRFRSRLGNALAAGVLLTVFGVADRRASPSRARAAAGLRDLGRRHGVGAAGFGSIRCSW